MKKHFYGTEWDWRHYEAVRNSRTPRGYFDDGRADWWVVVASIMALVVAIWVSV